jgi:DNA transformation protein
MSDDREFASHIVDLLGPFGVVEAKRMFGGFGVFHHGLMMGLISDASLYLKADQQNSARFEEEGMTRFSYFKKDREYYLSYYQAPDAFFDDQDDTMRWASMAYAAALRSAKKKKPKKKC